MLRRLLRRSNVLIPYKKYRESRDTAFCGVKEAVSRSLGSVGLVHFGRWVHLENDGLEKVEEYLLLYVCKI